MGGTGQHFDPLSDVHKHSRELKGTALSDDRYPHISQEKDVFLVHCAEFAESPLDTNSPGSLR